MRTAAAPPFWTVAGAADLLPDSRCAASGREGEEVRRVPALRFAAAGMTRGPISAAGGSQERPYPLLQQRDQFGLHEFVVVGDVEADDALALQMRAEAALESGAVDALHDEDEVGPVAPLAFVILRRAQRDRGTQRRRRRPVQAGCWKHRRSRQLRAPARRWVPRSAPLRGLPEDDERKEGRQAGEGGLDAGEAGEDPLSRGGAEAVAGAEGEVVGQGRGIPNLAKADANEPSDPPSSLTIPSEEFRNSAVSIMWRSFSSAAWSRVSAK